MNAKEELVNVFEELKEALLNCNQNKLSQLIRDDYKGFGLNGTTETKLDILSNFKPGFIQLSKYDVEELDVEIFDTVGIITGKGIIEGSYGHYKFAHNVLFTDIFVIENEKWKYYKSQVTEIAIK